MRSIRPRHSWPLFFVLLVSGFALVAAACGGDSDDNGSADNGSADNGSADNGGSGGGGDDDASYVRGLCNAVNMFLEDGQALIEDSGLDDPDSVQDLLDILEELGEITANFVDDLDDLNPPSDFAPFHDTVRDSFNSLAEALEDPSVADIDALSALGDIPLPPADISDRFTSVAENTSECQENGLFGAA